MKIEIHLYASLAKYLPAGSKNKSYQIALPEGSSIDDLMEVLNVPPTSVKLIFLNGIHAHRSSVLSDGDRVGIFPPVGGG